VRELLAALLVPVGLVGGVGADGSGVELTFRDPEIVESSGLAVVGDWVVTTNDSGDSGRLFVVDRSGATVGVSAWSSEPRDVEALAPGGAGEVWVGDIGDNSGLRDSVRVTPVAVGARAMDVDAPSYELVYPDGARDAETLMRDPTTGRLYVATKEIFGGLLYEAPEELDATRPNRLREVGEVLAIATDGAFFPDGRHLVVRGYDSAVVYTFPTLEEVGEVELPDQEQGEGIAVTGDGDLLLSTEGLNTDLLRVRLPEAIRAAMDPPPASPPTTQPPASEPPSTESREGKELPETTEVVRSPWPWFLGGFVGLGIIVVLMRSLRRR
jgi:hypothetical protein